MARWAQQCNAGPRRTRVDERCDGAAVGGITTRNRRISCEVCRIFRFALVLFLKQKVDWSSYVLSWPVQQLCRDSACETFVAMAVQVAGKRGATAMRNKESLYCDVVVVPEE